MVVDLVQIHWTSFHLSYQKFIVEYTALSHRKTREILYAQTKRNERWIYVLFSGPPVINVPRTYYSVSSGSSVTLEVNVTSSLDVTDLFWEKRNISTYIYERIDVQSESRMNGGNITCPSLTITNVNKNDNTYFRVKATNIDGTSTTYIYVYVVLSMYF